MGFAVEIASDGKARLELALGVDDYIVKPFSPGELVAKVRSHIAAYERIANGTSRGNARAAESSGDITTVAVHINRLGRGVQVSALNQTASL